MSYLNHVMNPMNSSLLLTGWKFGRWAAL